MWQEEGDFSLGMQFSGNQTGWGGGRTRKNKKAPQHPVPLPSRLLCGLCRLAGGPESDGSSWLEVLKDHLSPAPDLPSFCKG